MSSFISYRFSLHLYKTIFILFQIGCNTSGASSDFSTLHNSKYVQNDNGVVSFDVISPSISHPADGEFMLKTKEFLRDHYFNNPKYVQNDNRVVSFAVISPSISYPAGGGFGDGAIDLGGLEVYEAFYFKKIWNTHSHGPKGLSATFYEPTNIPSGFNLIGHYCKPNSKAIFTALLTAKDTTGDPSRGALKSPIDYTLVWTSKGLNVSQVEDGYIWLPIPPDGYKAVGHIVTTSPEKPSLDKVKCVRSDFTDLTKVDKWLWGHKMGGSSSVVSLYTTKPKTKTLISVPAGTFLAQNGSSAHELACLKMVRNDRYFAMPNASQITTMIHAYAPWVYFHPDEQYFPSSVLWFFQNGVELYQTGQAPEPVINDGDNLPNYGGPDDAFLDLPSDEPNKERVKKGSLSDAVAYIHVKPALGGTCTDLALWLYYPFNGGGRFQLGPFTINLGVIGEHVSDWEHITLRIDNFRGILKAVYLSQHANGKWLMPEEFEVINGTRLVVYASLHGHAHYATESSHIHLAGNLSASDIRMLNDEFQKMNHSSRPTEANKFGFGVRDDTAKSNNVMDIASTYNVICVDYKDFPMEPWVNYTGRWGPKITYGFVEEIMKVTKRLPFFVRKLAIKILKNLPAELLGQEAPQGPKMKGSWSGDENVS